MKLRRHVRRRLTKGWSVKTIRAQLGITEEEVIVFSGNALSMKRDFDSQPRLVKR